MLNKYLTIFNNLSSNVFYINLKSDGEGFIFGQLLGYLLLVQVSAPVVILGNFTCSGCMLSQKFQSLRCAETPVCMVVLKVQSSCYNCFIYQNCIAIIILR